MTERLRNGALVAIIVKTSSGTEIVPGTITGPDRTEECPTDDPGVKEENNYYRVYCGNGLTRVVLEKSIAHMSFSEKDFDDFLDSPLGKSTIQII